MDNKALPKITSQKPLIISIQWGLTLITIPICGWFIWERIASEWGTIGDVSLGIHHFRIALSFFCLMISIMIGAWIWSMILRFFGHPMPPTRAMYIHLLANLSKYIPGSIWPYLGKTILAGKNGIPINIAVLSILVEFTLIVFGGFIWTALSLPLSDFLPIMHDGWLWLELVGLVGLGWWLSFLPKIVAWLFKIITYWNFVYLNNILNKIDWNKIRALMLHSLLAWAFFIAGFILLIPHFGDSPLGPVQIVLAFVSSILIGLLAVFVPLGLGVREAVLISLLYPKYSAISLITISIIFRLEMIVGEVLCVLVLMAWCRRASHNTQWFS
jgi:glycosyltransferase 2 family protein